MNGGFGEAHFRILGYDLMVSQFISAKYHTIELGVNTRISNQVLARLLLYFEKVPHVNYPWNSFAY